MSVARARPDTQGVALTRWSLPKLAAHLAGMGIDVSAETLRQTLIGAGLSHQRTRSWKWSPDPDFQAKAERVLGLYRQCPPDGVVVCFDEMGPIQLIPHQGSGSAEQRRPERHRATYSKNGGVRYLFGAYDVHADRLHGRMRPHESGQEVLGFYRQIRMRYKPKIRIYLIADNLSAHKTPDIRAWAQDNNVELVFTPTYASLPGPNRVPLLGDRRVRRQQRRLPRLGHLQESHGRPHPIPQRPPPRPTTLKAERRLLIAA